MASRDNDSTPVPPSARKDLTVKQQREARRAEKVAALKKQQAKEKRNRTIGITVGAVAAVAVLGLVITSVVTSGRPDEPIAGVQTFDDLTATHVDGTVDYAQTPPAGGDHNAAWLNCGIYEQPVPNENAVHSLEHGAVWVTYDADALSTGDIEALREAVPETYSVLSPFDGLPSPVVISAWGAQLELDGVDDPRMDDFIDEFWQSPDAPEPGAACVQGVDAPGRIA
ncbi:DUF3105 domain-containing protein [Marisediminicola sp. LYQ85]|uniref:DUF3105 domain-containing protein n=1 Tax=Marisediminicola sp. LYQ85 TaxID=3391062 RepID=UPI003983C494